MPTAWATELLRRAQGRGWLSSRQFVSAESLLSHGLHPEQILIGGKIMDQDAYGELLSETTGLPFIRALESSLTAPSLSDELCRAYRVHPIAEDVTSAHLACASPDMVEKAMNEIPSNREFAGELAWYCMLWSEWRKAHPSPSMGWADARSGAADLVRRLDESGLHHVRILPGLERVSFFSDECPDFGASMSLPSNLWPGLCLRLRRTLATDGWRISEFETSHGRGWELVRTKPHDEQPHAWHWHDDSWLSDPRGLAVLIRPDAYVTHSVTERAEVLDGLETWRAASEKWNWKNVEDDESAEEVLHAALSGLPVIAIQQHDPSSEWWTQAAGSGLPVKLIRCRRSADGIAWEVLNYA